MSQTLLLSGPPGCGKTSRILKQIQSHSGPSGYLRLAGYPEEGLAQAPDPHPAGLLALNELPQFHPPAQTGPAPQCRNGCWEDQWLAEHGSSTLYDPGSDRIAFRTLSQQAGSRRRGFA